MAESVNSPDGGVYNNPASDLLHNSANNPIERDASVCSPTCTDRIRRNHAFRAIQARKPATQEERTQAKELRGNQRS